MSKLYADIIINISHEALDKVFQYEVPFVLREKIEPGMQVIVPFGRGNKEQMGYVIRLSQKADYDEMRIKPILRISEKGVSIESKMIRLAYWIREQYGSTMIQALRTVLPSSSKVERKLQKTIWLTDSEDGLSFLEKAKKKHRKAQVRLLEELLKHSPLSWELVTRQLKIPRSTLERLEEQKIIRIETKHRYRNPISFTEEMKPPKQLNEEQQKIADEFKSDFVQNIHKTYLLHGVTGSGKTEVYMAAIDTVLEQGRQAIVLIPEIALTYQTVKRFYQRFGDRISIMNSKLSQGERYDQMLRAQNGEIDIMIGPRSALFTPFQNLGLIVIDEEHESSYKSESVPKYHARETAIARASMEQASVILGSATPSIESYQKAISGTYRLWRLNYRANLGSAMANVYVEDLREELKCGNRSLFSRRLKAMIDDRLKRGQQIMLFLNRRGYAGFVSCRSCGHVLKCPHCDVSMTAHRGGKLVCHYCGHQIPMPKNCPKCGSLYIGAFGIGTQKVENLVQKEFPGVRTLRMDMDTTRKKHSYEEILSAFSNGEADILIGTQMIVKGHDFANTTLVGILAADMSLYANDFRASERTFQLLTQAAGRAGRGNLPGDVVIQTYNPEHYSIVAAAKQDYQLFFEQEIAYREVLMYPPMCQMMVIFIGCKELDIGEAAANMIGKEIKSYFQSMEELSMHGPSQAAITKIKDTYRYVIYLKHKEYHALIIVKNHLEKYMEDKKIFEKAQVTFDFNPMIGY
ncbi:MAG: primosomal protein N' [Lachnospiraceae bacterium]|nr:primosomal protein N' [Lachnospiraceae bacterium]